MAAATLPARASPFQFLLRSGCHKFPDHKFSPKSLSIRPLPSSHRCHLQNSGELCVSRSKLTILRASRSSPSNSNKRFERARDDDGDVRRRLLQAGLWVMEGVYVLWLFLLPYAPGDPVWAISSETVSSLLGLSLNFFFILPLANAVGIHVMEAPVLHPMSEGLFNFVIGWTLMFAPLLYSDIMRDKYKGSLDVLWGLQMFLTNTFLIPYMAIRLNPTDEEQSPRKLSQLGAILIKGAPTVGLIGGAVCIISVIWALFGRMDGNFGSLTDRWNFL